MKKVYIIAAALAVVTALCVFALGSSIINASKIDKEAVSVVVAATDIPEGTTVTPDMVTLSQINKNAVLAGVYTTNEAVVGMIANTTIYSGEQVTNNKVVSEEGISFNRLSYKIEEGYRAISIAVDDTTAVSGFIRAGDFADILYTVQTKNVTPNGMFEATTELLFEKCEVLAVGSYVASNSENESAYSTVTLALPLEDSMKLATYVHTISGGSAENSVGGKLTLVLRNKDDETTTTATVTNVN